MSAIGTPLSKTPPSTGNSWPNGFPFDLVSLATRARTSRAREACLSICLSVCPYNYLSCLSTSICLYLSAYLYLSLCVCLSVCLSVRLTVFHCLSPYPPPPPIYISIYISVYQCVCLSRQLSTNLYLSYLYQSSCRSFSQSIFLLHKKMRCLQHGAAWTLVASNLSLICRCWN